MRPAPHVSAVVIRSVTIKRALRRCVRIAHWSSSEEAVSGNVQRRARSKAILGVLAACEGECMQHQGSTSAPGARGGRRHRRVRHGSSARSETDPGCAGRSAGRACGRRAWAELAGNAVRALRALGVGDGLDERGVPVRRREYRNARDRLLFAVDEAAFWGAGAGSVCVRRGDVIELLRSQVAPAAVRFATAVSAVLERPGGVRSASWLRTESYDFVVGADGVHSAADVRSWATAARGPRCCRLPVGGS